MGCLVFYLGGDEALGIGPPWELDGLQEVAQYLSETFEVVVGRFTGDGCQFGRPVLEEGCEILGRGNLVLNHVG